MGLDLTLCPDRWSTVDAMTWHLAHTRIDLTRDYALFGQIDNIGRGGGPPILKPLPLPDDIRFQWYGDEGLEDLKTDPYGGPLTYLSAGELAKLEPGNTSAWNRGVLAFLRELDPATRVVLYWH